jgi:putative ABC transport system ATP-binding protein
MLNAMPAPLLTIETLRKTVPGGRVLFDGLSLELPPGAFVAVMGESGIGKSTLLNRITIDGTALDTLDDDARTRLRRDRIGFVFQAFHVLPHLTLAQNVALPLVLQHCPAAEALARAGAMLAAVGLAGRDGDYPRQLSGGELQRVAIGRALAHRPALILADEPTGNLDPKSADRVLTLTRTGLRARDAA